MKGVLAEPFFSAQMGSVDFPSCVFRCQCMGTVHGDNIAASSSGEEGTVTQSLFPSGFVNTRQRGVMLTHCPLPK